MTDLTASQIFESLPKPATPFLDVLRWELLAMPLSEIAAFSQDTLDYTPLGTMLSFAMIEHTRLETPDYLEHLGFFSYALLHEATTEAERDHFFAFTQALLRVLVTYHLDQNQIEVTE